MAEPEATSPCPPGGCTASPRSCEALGAERPTGQGLAGSQVGRGGEAAGLGATRCPSLLICKTVEPRDPPHRAAGRSREPARRLLLLSVCGGSLSHSTCLPRAPLRPVASAPPVLGAQDSESWGPCPGGEMVGESRYISGQVLPESAGCCGGHLGAASQEEPAGKSGQGQMQAGVQVRQGPERRKGGARQPMASARLVPAAKTHQALAVLWVGGSTGALGSDQQAGLEAGRPSARWGPEASGGVVRARLYLVLLSEQGSDLVAREHSFVRKPQVSVASCNHL